MNNNDEIDLKLLFDILKAKKIYIFFSTIIMVFIAFIYVSSLPFIYTSKTTLMPNEQSNSKGSQLNSISSLVGISIPGNENKSDMVLEIVNSIHFFETLVNKNDLLFMLQALKGWNKDLNKPIVDPKQYNEQLKKWVSKDAYNRGGIPSIEVAHKEFLKNFNAYKDTKTGFVHMSYNHYSAEFAQHLLSLIILEINTILRERDISISQKLISYYEQSALNSNIISLKDALSSLLENEIQKIAIAKSSPEYVLIILSPPTNPEDKSAPSKSLWLILTFIVSVFTNIIYFILRNKELK